MLTFLVIGLIGAGVLLLSFLLDGILDLFDFADGPLSLTTISAFTAVFGFSALTASSLGLGGGLSSAVGVVIGLLGAAGSIWITRALKRMDSSGHEESTFVGLTGTVTIAIPTGGLGEVAIQKAGDRLIVTARADRPMAVGKKVLVKSVLSANSVFVAPVPRQQTSR